MIKTQVQLPDHLYEEAKRVAREREISLAEVMRRGLEYIVKVYPPIRRSQEEWMPPPPRALGRFQAPAEDWRFLANDPSDPSRS
jgi:hypothetical protein